jgi:hypothetical protein
MGQETYHIGLDDTDTEASIGTGALARELSLHLERDLDADPLGITRHQLLLHPDVPYTSHNSAACIGLRCGADLSRLLGASRRFVAFLFHPGADPALCICRGAAPRPPLGEFGRRAQRELVDKTEALALASAQDVALLELGGEGTGAIGALAACGLRLGGEDGRFIALGDIRRLPRRTRVADLRRRAMIQRVVDESGHALDDGQWVETAGWVRPELRGGEIVLPVWGGAGGAHRVDREAQKRLEQQRLGTAPPQQLAGQ